MTSIRNRIWTASTNPSQLMLSLKVSSETNMVTNIGAAEKKKMRSGAIETPGIPRWLKSYIVIDLPSDHRTNVMLVSCQKGRATANERRLALKHTIAAKRDEARVR